MGAERICKREQYDERENGEQVERKLSSTLLLLLSVGQRMLVVIVVGEDVLDLGEDAVALLPCSGTIARRGLERAVFVYGAARRDRHG